MLDEFVRRYPIRQVVRFLSFLLLLTICSCTPQGPGFQREGETGWGDVSPLELRTIEGERDGERVAMRVHLVGEADEFRLDVSIVLGPPASFVRGSHESVVGGIAVSGPLEAEFIDFLGGQNDAPSVGGVFLFEAPEAEIRYRIRVPATPLGR